MVTTAVSNDFSWQDSVAGRVLRQDALALRAAHLFSSRQLAFRPETFEADAARLADAFGVDTDALVWVTQVHGRAVLVVRPGESVAGRPEADAIVSTDPDRVIAVRVADCVPVLIADRQGRAVAAVHAGWRGTCSAVSASAVSALAELGVPPDDLHAAIGPSIGPCCYQVDDRVRMAFLGMTPDAAAWFTEDGPGRWKLDLWQANADQLEGAGVPAAAIRTAGLCTADHLDMCFSYRAEGSRTGRLVAAVRAGGPAGRPVSSELEEVVERFPSR